MWRRNQTDCLSFPVPKFHSLLLKPLCAVDSVYGRRNSSDSVCSSHEGVENWNN